MAGKYGAYLLPMWLAWQCTFALPTQATVLVVTHPDTRFDIDSAAGPATAELLRNPDFCERLLLVGDGGLGRLTFDPTEVNYQVIRSGVGEIKWDRADAEVVLAGGHFNMCQMRTIKNIVQASRAPVLLLEVATRATYCLHVPSAQSVGQAPEGSAIPQSVTLADFRTRYGVDAFQSLVLAMLPDLYFAITHYPEAHEVRRAGEFRLTVSVNGNFWRVGKWGARNLFDL